VTEPAFVDALKGDANEVFGSAVWTETTPTNGQLLWKDSASYAAAALKAFSTPADYTQAGSSAAGIAFQVALDRVKAAPPLAEAARVALAKALESVDVQTFYGRVKFATDGEFYHSNVGLSPLTIQIQGGKVAVVGPAKDAKPRAMTPWAKRWRPFREGGGRASALSPPRERHGLCRGRGGRRDAGRDLHHHRRAFSLVYGVMRDRLAVAMDHAGVRGGTTERATARRSCSARGVRRLRVLGYLLSRSCSACSPGSGNRC
jgi:hypothetical protein